MRHVHITLRKLAHGIYREFPEEKKKKIPLEKCLIVLIFSLKTCEYPRCFGTKIRKLGIPLQPPFFYIKVGFKGVYISRAYFPDDVYFSIF